MSRFDPEIHHRRSIRLRGYDYSQAGVYFVTICVRDRELLLGKVIDDQMHLAEPGRMVQAVWEGLPAHYPSMETDGFVVMPNHIHGIIVLTAHPVSPDVVGAGLKPAPTMPSRGEATESWHGLQEIVRALKTFSARGINEWRGTVGISVWQRNYYEPCPHASPVGPGLKPAPTLPQLG
jgi:REP element-mobilizing transposase RayT